MRKIQDTFVIKNAADAMTAAREGEFENEKLAMNINIGPATIIGAITGAALAINKKKSK